MLSSPCLLKKRGAICYNQNRIKQKGGMFMAKCPNCGQNLRLTQWRPECPACGVNMVYYDQTAYTEGREQPEGAQKWIFAMATLLPAILVLSSMIPMFWFNVDRPTRDRMYRELNERRAAAAEAVKNAADRKKEEQDALD